MTFKQIIFQYLRTWLGTVQEAHGAGHCTVNTIPSFYSALHAILGPSLIGVPAGKYLQLILCKTKGFTTCLQTSLLLAAFQSGSPGGAFLAKREAKLSSWVPVDFQTHWELDARGPQSSQ